MMNHKDQQPRMTPIVRPALLPALLVISLLLNLVLATILLHRTETDVAIPETQRSLPCAAIPTRFILQEPECADKLIRVMNVTNVHILPKGSEVPGASEPSDAMLGDLLD